jgi:NADH dehydrogenase (ubiquinone) 1 alpha subcomplex subunit 9
MESLVTRLYRSYGLRTTDYEPVHARGLSNEFYCYANFESSSSWKWRQREDEGKEEEEEEEGGQGK